MQHETILTRRRVLLSAGSLTSAGVVGLSSTHAAAAGSTMTVWKLESDWGYPRGPHDKRRLHSNASRRAARHRYALTEANAEAMNLHKCSFAPAVAVIVDADSFLTLWGHLSYRWPNPTTGRPVRIFDDRHVDRIPGGGQILAQALSPSPAAAPFTPAPTGSVVAAPAAGDGARTRPAGGVDVPRDLALTGSRSSGLVAFGLGALATGVVALRSRRLHERDAPPRRARRTPS